MTTPDLADLKGAVRTALGEIETRYGSENIRAEPDGQGGVWIEIASVELCDVYAQLESFLICLLPFNLPGADVYPIFLRRDLSRRDGQALGEGFSPAAVAWPGDSQQRPVMQVSRRTRGGFTLQTPHQKICKVLDWVRSR